MRRRSLLSTAMLAASPTVAAAETAPLLLNGRATRTWSLLRIPIYDAALYSAQRSRDALVLLETGVPCVVELRFRRPVGEEDVRAAWAASLPAPLPRPFLGWLVAIQADDVERYVFSAGHVMLEGPRRPSARINDLAFSRALLGSFIGPEAPRDLRDGLLGRN